MIRRTSAATSRRTTWPCTVHSACPGPTSRNSQAIRSKARSCRRPTRAPGCRKSASSLLARSESPLLLEEALVDRLVLEDLLARETRSEEHTSELQSQFHLVCRLLLEKKKK